MPPPTGVPGQAYRGAEPPGGWAGAQPGALAGVRYADYGKRVAAWIIDRLVIYVPAAVIGLALGVGAFSADSEGGIIAFVGGILLIVLLAFIVSLVYAPLLMMRGGEHNGQTLGKQWLGIRVVRTSGEPMTFVWAALREAVVKNIAVDFAASITFGIAWLVNYLWPLWDDEDRALHDMAVSTRVVEA